MADLDSRSVIHDLVVRFYREIVFGGELKPVFSDVAEVDWAMHMPKLTDYWYRVLLGEPEYDGLILAAHQHVHDIQPLTAERFDHWDTLWIQTIDASSSGPIGLSQVRREAARGADRSGVGPPDHRG
jgi:hemoglobin